MTQDQHTRMSHRHALQAAADRLRVSFFIGVALVPTLLTQVFAGIGDRIGPWTWALILGVALAGFGLHAYAADRRRQRELARHSLADPDLAAPVTDLALITDLILTLDLSKPAGQKQNLHTLLPQLPRLQRIYGATGPFGGDAPGRFAELLAEAGAGHTQARLLQTLPAFELDGPGSERLRLQFEGLQQLRSGADVIAADVTGGTVPMSLSVFRAAVAAGIPVTYTVIQAGGGREAPRGFRRLVALYDPDSTLTSAPGLPATDPDLTTTEVP